MASKCTEPDCILSAWSSNDKCYFHTKDKDHFLQHAGQDRQEGAARAYVNTATNPGQGPTGSTLCIRGIIFDEKSLNHIKTHINRPIVFAECSFPNHDFFSGNSFNKSVSFDRCKVPSKYSEFSIIEFRDCTFRAGIRVESNEYDPYFLYCTFFQSTEIDTWNGESLNENYRTVEFHDCKFHIDNSFFFSGLGHSILSDCNTFLDPGSQQNGKMVFYAVHPNLYFNGGRFESDLIIDNRVTEDISLSFVQVGGKLILTSNYFQGDLPRTFNFEDLRSRIERTGEKAFTESQKIRLCSVTALNKFDSAKVLLSRINMSALSVCDFTIDGKVELDNIRFRWIDGRPVFWDDPVNTTKKHRNEKPLSSYDYQKLEESYRYLKQYYDRQQNHRHGNGFYASELFSSWHATICSYGSLKARQTRFCSLDSWYWYISNFGQSIKRPLLWILGSAITAWLLYAIIGFHPETSDPFTYSGIGDRVWNGAIFALQRLAIWFKADGTPTLVPFHWMGWVIGVLQTSITLVAGTFFILALRRRFKR